MFEDATIHAPVPPLIAPHRQRSEGIVCLRAGSAGGATQVLDLAEAGPLRLRFPGARAEGSRGHAREAVLVNTAGGIACGDRFETTLVLEAGADLILTSTAAEKIYRSDGPVSMLLNTVALDHNARLAWLPQETILFDHARLNRRFDADLAEGAELVVAEIVVFGRAAHGEAIENGLFHDAWRIRRGGRLTYADTLRLDGPISAMLERSAIGGGARAWATIIDVSSRAEGRLDEARALLEAAGANGENGVEAGASAWNGNLVVRALAAEAGALRKLVARYLTAYSGVPMPRVWQSA